MSKDLRVGFQGAAGAYSYLACKSYFSMQEGRAEFIGYQSFEQLLDAVQNEDVDYAMLPVENSLVGTVHEAVSAMRGRELFVVGEERQKVEHCLIAIREVPLENLRRIYSHPQALAQCSDFIGRLGGCEAIAYVDTALAVKKICEDNDPSAAAIASLEAATLHKLVVIKREIANAPNNHTRMLVISKTPG